VDVPAHRPASGDVSSAGQAALAPIDWSRPWLAPYRQLGAAVAAQLADGADVAAALNHVAIASAVTLAGLPLRFVPQAALDSNEPYETFIRRSGQVPTRDNLHDLFNGLAWLAFAPLKAQLNALHAAQIARDGIGARRGAVRDALTLFDENGAWWAAPASLAEALRRRDWHALFVEHRALWQHARPTLFGHALLEKLTRPRKAITAHVWLLPESDDPLAALSSQLEPQRMAARPYLPLPVLGVPLWWPANADSGFYGDESVFRPQRAAS
jgi:hypothetical protein